jgi:hypothetical protein
VRRLISRSVRSALGLSLFYVAYPPDISKLLLHHVSQLWRYVTSPTRPTGVQKVLHASYKLPRKTFVRSPGVLRPSRHGTRRFRQPKRASCVCASTGGRFCT